MVKHVGDGWGWLTSRGTNHTDPQKKTPKTGQFRTSTGPPFVDPEASEARMPELKDPMGAAVLAEVMKRTAASLRENVATEVSTVESLFQLTNVNSHRIMHISRLVG